MIEEVGLLLQAMEDRPAVVELSILLDVVTIELCSRTAWYGWNDFCSLPPATPLTRNLRPESIFLLDNDVKSLKWIQFAQDEISTQAPVPATWLWASTIHTHHQFHLGGLKCSKYTSLLCPWKFLCPLRRSTSRIPAISTRTRQENPSKTRKC